MYIQWKSRTGKYFALAVMVEVLRQVVGGVRTLRCSMQRLGVGIFEGSFRPAKNGTSLDFIGFH